MWQLVFASCHRLISQQDKTRQQQQAKRVPDGHGGSYGSWPWQKPYWYDMARKKSCYKIFYKLSLTTQLLASPLYLYHPSSQPHILPLWPEPSARPHLFGSPTDEVTGLPKQILDFRRNSLGKWKIRPTFLLFFFSTFLLFFLIFNF